MNNATGNRIIVGRKYAAVLAEGIKELGAEIAEMPDNPLVDCRLSGHVDMTVFLGRPDEVVIPVNLKGGDIDNFLLKLGFKIEYSYLKQGSAYPSDAIVNACLFGEHLLCNTRTIDKKILEKVSGLYSVIDVRQGYTGCSVCRIGNDSIITADSGIHSSALKAGLNSLLIKPGHIELEGYDCGFIGGSAFMYDDGHLIFTGAIESHPSYQDICAFLNDLHVDFVCLTDRTVFDIGGAIVLSH